VNAALEVGGLRGAVNCAGVASAEKVLGREGPHSLDSFAKVVQINLIGTFNVIRLAAEAMVSSDPSESAALSSTRPAWPHSTARSGR
jgi:3-hydroxyacyl-CoA dehydrogenase / 3-hydroxy-2-methylbutyryl-CoA dehydrogenase